MELSPSLVSGVLVSAVVAVPFVVGVLLLALGARFGGRLSARWPITLALLGAGGAAALTATVLVRGAEVRVPWVAAIGLDWSLGVTALSRPFVLLTVAVTLLVVLHAVSEPPDGGALASYLGAVLLVEAGALASFLARDALLFFIALEVVLVPMWFVIARFGDARIPERRTDAAYRFIIYTAVGSTLLLIGILVSAGRSASFDLDVLTAREATTGSTSLTVIAALLLIIGLAVKIPVVPVHTWLPPAHTIAPTGGSVLLAAVLLKIGTYGLIRLPMSIEPTAFALLSPWLALAGGFGVLWGGLICLAERDLKRLIAYSSVAHMGFVALAVATGTVVGVSAVVYTSIAHGVIAAFLFFLVGGLKHRWGSADLSVPRPALREVSPRLGFLLVLGMAATMGLPGLAGFWGELLSLMAAYRPGEGRARVIFLIALVMAAVGAALAAAYAVRVLRLVWVGEAVRSRTVEQSDVRGVELAVLAVLGIAIVALGVAPALLIGPSSGLAELFGWLP